MANNSVSLQSSATPEIERRRRLAQLLQEQAGTPIDIQSSGGIQAGISPFSVLAKGLQGYFGADQERKADDEEKEYKGNKYSQTLAALLGKEEMNPVTVTPQMGIEGPAGTPEARQAAYSAPEMSRQGGLVPAGQAQKYAQLLGGLDPEIGGPIAGQLLAQQFKSLEPKDPIKLGENDRLIDPSNYSQLVGAAPNPNKPFNSDGTPNEAYMAYELRKASAGRSVTNVNNNMGQNGIDYGKPEEGLAWQRDPSGRVVLDARGAPVAIPYQGGKQYREDTKVDKADEFRKAQAMLSSDVVVQDANRVLDISGKNNITGIAGAALSTIPGTPQRDAKGLIDTIKSNVAFDRLQKMREASPTGGALGAVSAPELNLLQSAIGNLEQSQSKDQFERNVKRVREIYIDTIHGKGTAAKLYGQKPDTKQPQKPTGKTNLKEKYGLD